VAVGMRFQGKRNPRGYPFQDIPLVKATEAEFSSGVNALK